MERPHKHNRKPNLKNARFLFRVTYMLSKDSLTKLYYSCIHCCLDYANMAGVVPIKCICIRNTLNRNMQFAYVYNENKFAHAKLFM